MSKLREKALGYSDDLTVICRGKHLNTLSDLTQRGVKITEKWCNEVGLTVNPNKSEIVIFTKNWELVSFHEPTLFGAKISRKQSAKYLGITMDSRLN